MMTCSCGIDVHAHVVPEHIPAYLAQPDLPGWPSMAPVHACHRHVMIDGKVYRTVSKQCWDVPSRVADMESMGLRLQVVSPMPELFSYWLPAAAATDLLRYVNDLMAEMVAQSGGRLAALGAVPLQNLDGAIQELHRVRRDLGFAGVEIGSNINGRPIGAPEFDPFFAAAEAEGAAVFVHSVRPAGMDRLVGPAPLQQALGYPTDIGLAAASVITGNLMQRFPRLRIAVSHGGGTLGLLLPRLEQARQVFAPLQKAIAASPTEQARRLFYDALVFDAPTLRHLVALFGDSQIMLGTDHPFNFHDRMPVSRVMQAIEHPATRSRLLYENAQRFLGLDPS
ncbi:MAG: aminocarboxymuconate-semialdehyde decarboxylase [Acetobacteraceae bacterium]|nr:aminocarboxymuconate-semialdehyde decarboxylase [Acetobacteraceae bacterium]